MSNWDRPAWNMPVSLLLPPCLCSEFQPDAAASPRCLVDSKGQRERAASFLARHHRLPLVSKRRHKIGNETPMPFLTDAPRTAARARCHHSRRGYSHASDVWYALRLPARDLFALKLHASACSIDLYAMRIPRRGGSGGDHAPQRAVPEAHCGRKAVLDLNRVSQGGHLRLDFGHIAQMPEEQVKQMNPLIHQRATAVQRPGAAPGSAFIIALRAQIGNSHAAQNKLAQRSSRNGRLSGGKGRVSAPLKGHAQ